MSTHPTGTMAPPTGTITSFTPLDGTHLKTGTGVEFTVVVRIALPSDASGPGTFIVVCGDAKDLGIKDQGFRQRKTLTPGQSTEWRCAGTLQVDYPQPTMGVIALLLGPTSQLDEKRQTYPIDK
jgi:hypothetical protein